MLNKDKISIGHIADIIKIPESPQGYVMGYLDWITGTIRLNLTTKEYHSLPEDHELWAAYLKTSIHEMFHFYQILTSGYLYNYVVTITTDVLVNTFNMESNLLFDAIKRIEFPVISKEEVVGNINSIRLKSNGLSVLDLVEGAAFYAQEVAKEENVTHESILRKLKLYRDTEYSRAYLLLNEAISDKTFHIFPILVYFSLKFSDPVYAFFIILKNIKKINELISNDYAKNMDLMRNEFVSIVMDSNENPDNFGIVENPLEIEEENENNHPFYSDSIKLIRSSDCVSFNDIVTLLTKPEEFRSEFFLETLRPVLLNDGNLLYPNNMGSGIFNTQDEIEAMIVSACVASYKILKDYDAGPKLFIHRNA